MIEARGYTIADLDASASEQDKPFAVITADCSGAHEFDDAIAVTPLTAASEMYRVHVFAVDTSRLYYDEEIARRAMMLTESKYGTRPDGSSAYAPMLDSEMTQRLHFAEGATRRALAISFVIGAKSPPTDIDIGFGQVHVRKNLRYDVFGNKCRYSSNATRYGRAAALIMHHLGTEYSSEEETYHGLIHVPGNESFKRGAVINQAFMVAANHLVGKTMKDEERLAIYRAHDSEKEHLLDVISPRVARYTTEPTAHHGLGLDIYARVTSPLRRVEDFVNVALLKARHQRRELNPRDKKIVGGTLQRLNQRVATEQFNGPLQLHRDDLYPSKPRSISLNLESA